MAAADREIARACAPVLPFMIERREEVRSGRMRTLSLALVSAGLFATTNVDDLFLLVGFFSGKSLAHWQVVVGQIVGVAVLIAVSLTAALAALALSPAYVGLLGLVPIDLGLMKFRALRQPPHPGEQPSPGRANVKGAGAFGVAAVTIASGGDNIGVYTPFLASQTPEQIAVTIGIFAFLTILWCFVAWRLVAHRTLGGSIRRFGPIILPIVLIALGASILYGSGAGKLVARFL
jgi:cadmium resistance protein CadD (predicted permease)